MTTCRLAASVLLVVLCGSGASRADEPRNAAAAPADAILLTMRLELQAPQALTVKDVRFGPFPGGRRCCFTYTGPVQTGTVAVLSRMGFRTTIYCKPDTPAERLQGLEQAGADIGIGIWGAAGNYGSIIGANTVQGAFDACITSRQVLKGKCAGPLAAASIGGHYDAHGFLLDRNPDRKGGFGYAFHDGNYLVFADNKPYPVLLGRQREPGLLLRPFVDNAIDARNVPNELIYYQVLANQFLGTLRRVEKGQVVRFSLRDFDAPDLEQCNEVIGPYGQHPQIWHATDSMIGANEYLRAKSRVREVRADGASVDVVLALEPDVFAPFLLTPLPLLLPPDVKVKAASLDGTACAITNSGDGVCVDVPVGPVLRGSLQMSLTPARGDMTIPDEMPVTLTLRNPSARPVDIRSLKWIGTVGLTVSGGEQPLRIPAGGEQRVQATARSATGARFGLTPVSVLLTCDDGRPYLGSFELLVAPRLRVEVDPMQSVPIAKGRWQYFLVHVNNATGPGKFISERTGPCKGTVALDLPPGLTSEPAEQPFELGKEESRTLVFRVSNDRFSSAKGERVRPLIKFQGETEAVATVFPGTTVIRDEDTVAPKPLDDQGLLFLATWDDPKNNGRADKAAGNPAAYFYPGHQAAYFNEGVKAWCMNTAGSCEIFDTWKNIDFFEGTACFWVRKDPQVRNELPFVGEPEKTRAMSTGRSNSGETLFTAGDVQSVRSSCSGLTLRRFRSWQGKPGYLQLTYSLMGGQTIVCQASPFDWTDEWRHVALLWSVKDRRLELYLDGKLASKADPGEGPWMASPWDQGRDSGHALNLITTDHGAWSGTCRDEVSIHRRALAPQEIADNLAAARKK